MKSTLRDLVVEVWWSRHIFGILYWFVVFRARLDSIDGIGWLLLFHINTHMHTLIRTFGRTFECPCACALHSSLIIRLDQCNAHTHWNYYNGMAVENLLKMRTNAIFNRLRYESVFNQNRWLVLLCIFIRKSPARCVFLNGLSSSSCFFLFEDGHLFPNELKQKMNT